MAKRTAILLFAFAAAAFGADPVIGTVTINPTFAPANTPTQITLTALITDPTLIANGGNVQRLNALGNATAVLGLLHDDGLNGDAVAGDHIYTLVFTLNEANAGRIFFRTTAAFQGVLQRVSSSRIAVDIATSASPLSIDAIATPVPNAAGWNQNNVTVTFVCAGGAGGSEQCPGIVLVSTEGDAETITGVAQDGSGNTVTKSVAINLDKTAPALSITSPPNGAFVTTPFVIVTGTVTDAVSGVASFTCNGQTASVNGSAFSCNLPLVLGANAITVKATDVAGNTATSNLSVTYGVSTLTISATPSPAPNGAGWNNTDVAVVFSCSGGAPPVACPPSVVISTESGNQVISRTATDAVGSTATASVTLKIDKTPPGLTITSPGSAANVTIPQITVTGTVTDALSGVGRVTCNSVTAVVNGPNFFCGLTLVTGPNSISVQATDVAGNISTSNLNVTLGAALTISATPSPAPNSAGWNNTNVTVTFNCAGGVGTVTCPQPVVVSTEGANQTISRTATDSAGNMATASASLKIDKTPPTVVISSPASGATVTNSQVNLTGTVTDALSGISSVTCNGSPATLTQSSLSCTVALTAGPNTIIVQAIDVAGNATAISRPVTFSVTPLTMSASPSPAPNAGGWNNANVTVTFACAGGTGTVTCPQPVVVSTEGANQTISRTATDSAGNTATASVTLRIDKTPPTLAITSPVSGATVTSAQLNITGTVTDALSGLAGATCKGVAATLTQSNLSCAVTLTAGLNTIAIQATDVAGNSISVSLPVTFTASTLTLSATPFPAPNAAGWNNSNVTVIFTCTGGSGTVTCPQPAVVSTEGAGQVVSRTATDTAGDMATASVTLKIDKTPPALTVTSPTSGATLTSSPVSVTGATTDALSGIAGVTCNGQAATLASTNFSCNVTLALGANSITVVATDIAGNTSTSPLSVTYGPSLTISLSAPANLSYLNISPTTVGGTVSDSAATVTINSISAPVANGQFSVQIPLAEGPNILTATATAPSGSVATASIEVTLDTTPPHVSITSPPDKFITTDTSISIAGIVNDIVVGTVNDQQAQVNVNGSPAQVSNRTFLATNVPLNLGDNVIQAVGRDRVGNAATTQITVTRQAPSAQSQIHLISGNNQTSTIGASLPAPLVVSLTDAGGNPLPNKSVIFKITQNNGMIAAGGSPASSAVATTNAQGQAQVQWTLGMRAGAGGNTVEAYSVGAGGTAIFNATGNQGPAGKIVIDANNDQIGVVNQALPKPLIAVVIDDGNNRLANVPVTFTVKQGGGSLVGQSGTTFTVGQNGTAATGQQSVTVNSDSDGRVAATLILGFQEGNANNLVEADFTGNQSSPATFAASGRAAGDPTKTTISGVVLDNSNVPIPGATIRAVLTNVLTSNATSVNSAATVLSDAQGQFSLSPAPVGFVKLMIDGSTAQLPGTYPHMDYDMVTVAGQVNTVGQPVYLLPLSATNQLCATATTGGGTLTIPEGPGFSLTFGPGQVTFPGGTKTGCIGVTVVHGDRVPMAPGFGQQPRFIVTIQPAGATFNPPAAITLPNVDGLKPREVTEMYSFDHDIGSFVAIGTGTVSDDGQVIRSNQGVGVLKAGWHCGGNPSSSGVAATCPICFFCPGSLASCQPQGNGTPCGNGGTCQFGRGCVGGGGCQAGFTLNAAGQCCQGATCTPPSCPQGQTFNSVTGTCVNAGPCPPGYTLNNGQCCTGTSCAPPSCPQGQTFDPTTGTCINTGPCLPGYTLNNGQCCQGNICVPPSCPSGQTFNPTTGTCVFNTCTPQTAGASCTCGGSGIGTCNSTGQCTMNGQTCGGTPSVTITSQFINEDTPGNTTYAVLPAGTPIYAGSEDSTSDSLQLSAAPSQGSPPVTSYTWTVSGPGSSNYQPPSASSSVSQWVLGKITSPPGTLSFTVTVSFLGGQQAQQTQSVQVGVRTDDTILLAWIKGSDVTLPSGASTAVSSILSVPPVPSPLQCNAFVGQLTENSTNPLLIPLTTLDRVYVLSWLFRYAGNSDPSTVIAGGDFRNSSTSFTDETKLASFVATRTNFKLFNRFQIKFTVDPGGTFANPPVALHRETEIGTTVNPCGPIAGLYAATFPGQVGPSDGLPIAVPFGNTEDSLINDGSPDSAAIRAFNTLTGKDVVPGIFWENIGSRITFSPSNGTNPSVTVQPYPTYYEYRNGKLVNTISQAASPLGNFQATPYPFGTVPCIGAFGTTPGGRCGDAQSAPDSTARHPPYTILP